MGLPTGFGTRPWQDLLGALGWARAEKRVMAKQILFYFNLLQFGEYLVWKMDSELSLTFQERCCAGLEVLIAKRGSHLLIRRKAQEEGI